MAAFGPQTALADGSNYAKAGGGVFFQVCLAGRLILSGFRHSTHRSALIRRCRPIAVATWAWTSLATISITASRLAGRTIRSAACWDRIVSMASAILLPVEPRLNRSVCASASHDRPPAADTTEIIVTRGRKAGGYSLWRQSWVGHSEKSFDECAARVSSGAQPGPDCWRHLVGPDVEDVINPSLSRSVMV